MFALSILNIGNANNNRLLTSSLLSYSQPMNCMPTSSVCSQILLSSSKVFTTSQAFKCVATDGC